MRVVLVAGCALLAGVLFPITADARHRNSLTAASGPRDADGPKIWTATHTAELFFDKKPEMRLFYQVVHNEPVNVRIKLIRTDSGKVLKRWVQTVSDDEQYRVKWNGVIRRKLKRERRYAFRLVATDSSGTKAKSASSDDKRRDSFPLWHHRFPVRGKHDYGGSGARFGAPRGSRTHQGQDVMANCGTRLQAARGGRVEYRGYQSAAGHYVVISGKKTGVDYVYMHLEQAATVGTGERVRTGQTIGKVGQTGNAVGCHLHFEMWSPPGWYKGGSPFDPLPSLKHWDSYS